MMDKTNEVSCSCGSTRLELSGAPFMVTECLCNSCRAAAERLSNLPGAKLMTTPYGATACAEYRKDRVRFLSDTDKLRSFKLTDKSTTRRVVAACCNTPVFIEAKGGHWLSLYLHLWNDRERPKPQLRTMTGDLEDSTILPNDIPNYKTHSIPFYGRLLWAWIAMGFRNPKIDVKGVINA
jgi:hypothetical protein